MERVTTSEYLHPLVERVHFDFWEPLSQGNLSLLAWLIVPVLWLFFGVLYVVTAIVRRAL